MLWSILCSKLLSVNNCKRYPNRGNRWHGTLLAKIALIPQNLLNSYTEKDHKLAGRDGMWKDGDFMVSFPDCSEPPRSCKEDMDPWFRKTEVSASVDV